MKKYDFLCGITLCLILSACGSGSSIYSKAVPKSDRGHINSEVKFSEDAYGVAASPRMTTSLKVRKGGGRRQVGKPYKIRGKWYYPKEDLNYSRVGQASWYGPNFHGRLTANGEVYDQYALTGAHPTFPLPSYASVTNLANGRSIVVRINDRGPFHPGRIIDLSAKASKMLDYQKKGVARVKVKYLRQAPLHGLDHAMLLASFKSGNEESTSEIAEAPKPAIEGPFDRIATGSIKNSGPDPFLQELEAIKKHKDTGSTLSLRLKDQNAKSAANQ